MALQRKGLGTECDAAASTDVSTRVLELFGPQEAYVEDALSGAIVELMSRFSSAPHVSSDVDPRVLAEQFADTRMPEQPGALADYLRYLDDSVLAHSVRTSSPRCLALMSPPVAYFMPHLARLVASLNQNLVRADASKAFTPFERETLAVLHRLVYDQPEAFYARHTQDSTSTLGLVVSGATLANVGALWCARNACLPAVDGVFGGVDRQGLAAALAYHDYADAVVIASTSVHYSVVKAADLLGIGSSQVILVPTDRRDRIDVAALRKSVGECRKARRCVVALVCVAGSTETGSVDPLIEVAAVAREYRIHFHVDAAWGGPVLFCHRRREMLRGIECADSVTLDGHKQLYTPTGTGVLLLRNPVLAEAIEHQANYIIRQGSLDLGNRSVEGSRPASALLLHAGLHLIGRAGYEWLIEHGLQQTQYAAAAVRARRNFELLLEPELNILLYRYVPARLADAARQRSLGDDDNRTLNELNEWIHARQSAAGRTLVSRTIARPQPLGHKVPLLALRAVFANPLTTPQDIEAVLDEQDALGCQYSG